MVCPRCRVGTLLPNSPRGLFHAPAVQPGRQYQAGLERSGAGPILLPIAVVFALPIARNEHTFRHWRTESLLPRAFLRAAAETVYLPRSASRRPVLDVPHRES